MKRAFYSIFYSALILAGSVHAMSSRQAIDMIKAAATNDQPEASAATNTPSAATNRVEAGTIPVESAPVPKPASGSAIKGTIATGSFCRPSIAIAADGRAFVSAEGPDMGSTYTWTLAPGATAWTGGLAIEGTKNGPADAGRVYLPVTLPNGITAGRLGPKEWGKMHGPFIVVQKPNGKTSFRFTGYTTGAPRLAYWSGKSFLMTKNGAWAELDDAGAFLRTGTWPAGGTGEKFAFDIGPDGRWHTAVNGYSAEDAGYASSPGVGPSGGHRVTWAKYSAFPSMGNDLCYVSVVGTTNGAVISTVYGSDPESRRLRLQRVTKAGSMVYPVDKLCDLGPAALEDRCPPRLVNTPAGVIVVWRRGTDLLYGRTEGLERTARGKGDYAPRRLAAGSFPAAAWDPRAKALTVVFCAGGGLQAQSIPLATLAK